MSVKRALLSAAAVGISSGTVAAQAAEGKSPAHFDMHTPKDGVKCFGANACKGTAACAVTQEQIKVANQAFKNKFLNVKPHECGGGNTCSASTGSLVWIKKTNPQDCFKSGGFVFEKSSDPKTKKETLVIRKS